MNEDRHLNNFGIIRDVNSLEWISVALYLIMERVLRLLMIMMMSIY